MGMMDRLRWEKQKRSQRAHYEDELRKMEQRKQGNIPPEFERLSRLSDKYAGQICWIVADAAIADIAAARRTGVTVFGTDALLRQELPAGCKPDYIGIQNPQSFREMKQRLIEDYPERVFCGDNLPVSPEEPLIWYPYLGVYKYYCNRFGEYNTKFSSNALEVVYDGYSVVYSLIQLAVYLGFAEIHLVGCPMQGERLSAAYRAAKQYADAHGIRLTIE